MKGSGTSMVSLIIPKKGQLALVNKMLTEELGTATNIKSRVNKLSVLSAIVSTQQKLKLYKKIPKNGLVIFSGTITTDNHKEKKVSVDFEPFKPINKSLYLCDNKFHVENLKSLLETDEKYGFIIIDGDGIFIATLSGDNKETLIKFNVSLPKKHKKGGQSALRFARLRLEARYNYLKKACESIHKYFLKDNVPTIKGLILAGNADFKNKLYGANIFSPVLKKIVINIVDISYGGENGLNQAIELSKDCLKDIKFVKEKKILAKYFDQISQSTNKYCFGPNNTINALEMGAIDTLLLWEDLDFYRIILKSSTQEKIIYQKNKTVDASLLIDDQNEKFDVIEIILLIDWLTLNYKKFGAKLVLISDKTSEGNQFCNGFGGLGGMLRWEINFMNLFNQEIDDFEDNFI